MDKKTTIQAVLGMLMALAIWLVVVNVFFPPPPESETPLPERQPIATDASPEAGEVERPADWETDSLRAPAVAATSATDSGDSSAYNVPSAERGASIILGDVSEYRGGRYRMLVELDQRGAAIQRVLLSDYLETVTPKGEIDQAARFQIVRPVEDPAAGVEYLSLPTRAVNILTGDKLDRVLLDNVIWEVTEPSVTEGGQAVTFRTPIRQGDRQILEIEKRYELPSEDYASGRYDLYVSLRIRNTGEETIAFSIEQDGPTGVMQEGKRANERYVFSGVRSGSEVDVKRKRRGDLRKQVWVVENDSENPLAWMVLANKYFMFVMAPGREEGDTFGDLIARAEAFSRVNGEGAEAESDLTYRFVSSRQTLRPGAELTFHFACFVGPKARKGLEKNADYLERNYIGVLDSGYTWCTFVGLAKLMTALLALFFRITGNYGVAIIVLVLIVRTVLHPITKKGQVNMVKMQEQMSQLQPKMEELKKRFGNDKAKLNQETMALYRDAGMSPVGQLFTCLPMVLQMPIWVALWTSLNYTVEMRHQPFFLWIRDLTGTDAINEWFGWHFEPFDLPLISGMIGTIEAFNLLPIVLSATMYFQQKFMPKPAQASKRSGKTMDQLAQQQKMMSIMMVFFGVLFYNAPAGLNLYIMSSNIFGMIEQWRIRKHIAEEKEKGKFAAKPKKPDKNGKPGIWGRLERIAEDAKRVQSSRQGKRKMS